MAELTEMTGAQRRETHNNEEGHDNEQRQTERINPQEDEGKRRQLGGRLNLTEKIRQGISD